MWSFDIFKQWGFPEQDKFKKGIGYTQVGGAGDISGEAAMPDEYGRTTVSGIVQQQRQKKGHKKGVMETVNMVPSPYGANQLRPIPPKTINAPDAVSIGQGDANQQNLSWLARMTGVDLKQAQETWKNKGGFEGLMANPAFTMGLAFMQAGAEGKTLGQGSLDNVMKAAGLSSHYKRVIEARKQAPIQATAADMAEVESLLKSINIEEGNWLENLVSKAKGGNPGAEWSAAVEEIAVQYQAEIQKWQAQNKHPDGTPKIIRQEDKIKIMNKLIKSGKIKRRKSMTGGWLSADTIAKPIPKPMARGGPMKAGKSYLVGEQGPEVVIPRESAKVLSNDDSKIYAMLLAANPQLQKVSRARSEKILRNRFPEYFE